MKYIILAITLLLTSCLNTTEKAIAKEFLNTQCIDYELSPLSRDYAKPKEEGHASCLCENGKWRVGGLYCGNKTCTWTGNNPCGGLFAKGSGLTTYSSSAKPEKIIETKIETVYVEKKDNWDF